MKTLQSSYATAAANAVVLLLAEAGADARTAKDRP